MRPSRLLALILSSPVCGGFTGPLPYFRPFFKLSALRAHFLGGNKFKSRNREVGKISKNLSFTYQWEFYVFRHHSCVHTFFIMLCEQQVWKCWRQIQRILINLAHDYSKVRLSSRTIHQLQLKMLIIKGWTIAFDFVIDHSCGKAYNKS